MSLEETDEYFFFELDDYDEDYASAAWQPQHAASAHSWKSRAQERKRRSIRKVISQSARVIRKQLGQLVYLWNGRQERGSLANTLTARLVKATDMDPTPGLENSSSEVVDIMSPKAAVQNWEEAFNRNELSCSHFRAWWRRVVPSIFLPDVPHDRECFGTLDSTNKMPGVDDDYYFEKLLQPLEEFLCRSDRPEDVFRSLLQLNNPPSLCGKPFKMGEPTYGCHDCGIDRTCVLCMDCFKESEHKHHSYRMSVSLGGGYCDCGDVEAWKAHSHCTIHSVKNESITETNSPESKLGPEVAARARVLISAVVKYIYEMLTTDSMLTLPSDLAHRESVSNVLDQSNTNLEAEEQFVLVFYNNDFNTFESCVETLTKAVDFDREFAINCTTVIDREGRAPIKAGGFGSCNEVKRSCERVTSRNPLYHPFRIVIMHWMVYAHQTFAMKLLEWLHKILEINSGFRHIFFKVVQEPDKNTTRRPLIEAILRNYTVMWKAARKRIHHVLVSGLLMEPNSKEEFARVFTRCYSQIIKDFFRDEQEHRFSITSLSVQVFTKPTLAHLLIRNEDVLAILLRTYISELIGSRTDQGKLNLQHRRPHETKSSFILIDIKYLLTQTPNEWDTPTRKGFLHGFSMITDILSWMQGMDEQIRQASQDVVQELEWRPAFTFLQDMTPPITLFSSWCCSDRLVFIKAIRMIFKKIHAENQRSALQLTEVEVNGKSANCIDYAVTSKPVSMHAPLTRILGGFSPYLTKFGLKFDSHEFLIDERPSPIEMMEPSLRMLTFVAQIQAGAWRRNRSSLLNQVGMYKNPLFRKLTLDQDVIMVQWAASLMDPDEFIINIVSKFQLVNWAENDFVPAEEDSIRQWTSYVEEFLGVLTIILCERFVPGVGEITAEEAIQNEIIHILCKGHTGHSSLNKALTRDAVSRDTGLDKVIETVATFKKPALGSTDRGIYELKPEFYSHFNTFFYHYTKEDMSKASESQRARLKEAKEPQCYPPPVPPRFTEQFKPVTRIMTCDNFLYILSLVLQRADNLKSRCFSENMVHRALHLIGICLHEEEQYGVQFTEAAEKFELLGSLKQLVGSKRIDSQKELLDWVLAKWAKLSQKEDIRVPDPAFSTDVASSDEAAAEKKRKAELRRQQLMAKMQSAQTCFIKENKELFEDTPSGTEQREDRASAEEAHINKATKLVALGINKSPPVYEDVKFTCILCQEEDNLNPERLGLCMPGQVQRSTVLSRRPPSDRDAESLSDGPMSLSSVTQSTQYKTFPILSADLSSAPYVSSCGHVMHVNCWNKSRRNPLEQMCPLCRFPSNVVLPVLNQLETLQRPSLLLDSQKQNIEEKHVKATNIDFSEWIQAYVLAVKYKRELSEDDEKNMEVENQATPDDDETETTVAGDTEVANEQEDLMIIQPKARKTSASNARKRYYTCPLDQILQEMTQLGHDSTAFSYLDDHASSATVDPTVRFSNDLFDMIHNFTESVYKCCYNKPPECGDERVPLILWQSCAFTIHSVVNSIDFQKKSLLTPDCLSSRQRDCLTMLVRLSGLLSGYYRDPPVMKSHALKLLSTLLEVDTANLSLLEFDTFGALVVLTYCLPNLFTYQRGVKILPSGSVQDQHMVHLLFVAHLVQILLTTDQFSAVLSETSANEDQHKEGQNVLDLLHLVRQSVGFAGEGDGVEGLDPAAVWRDLQTSSLPFLRCCAIFFHLLTSCPLPTMQNDFEHDLISEEFRLLTQFLGLPSQPSELLSSPHIGTLAKNWANHPHVHILLDQAASQSLPVTYPLRPNLLMQLPEDYSDLINSVSGFSCPKSMTRVPTMCLVCGSVLCSQSYCCQTTLDNKEIGACTNHAAICGAGNGIFLRVKECKLVLLSNRYRACFYQPPYVDKYGEMDIGFRRGNPLKLCPERFRKIQKMWIDHGILEEISQGQSIIAAWEL